MPEAARTDQANEIADRLVSRASMLIDCVPRLTRACIESLLYSSLELQRNDL